MSRKKQLLEDKVAIALCTMNGEKYIQEQLDSIRLQTFDKFDLFISDDGSDDSTTIIISNFIKRNPNIPVYVLQGPKLGFAKNFIITLTNTYDVAKKKYKYYAFCDQDDIWCREKLEIAIKNLKLINSSVPGLYCGRTSYIDETGNNLGLSPLFKKKPSFRNALVQSIAGGNTMVFNYSAYIELIGVDLSREIISHDWLLYLLVAVKNGKIIYDPIPQISYRQHQKNIIGSNNRPSKIFKRFKSMIRGDYSAWIKTNLEHIDKTKLNQKNLDILEKFNLLGSDNIFLRIKGLAKTQIYRQTFFGNITLIIATILKKIL